MGGWRGGLAMADAAVVREAVIDSALLLRSLLATQCDSPAIRGPPYCTGFECGDFWRRGHAHST